MQRPRPPPPPRSARHYGCRRAPHGRAEDHVLAGVAWRPARFPCSSEIPRPPRQRAAENAARSAGEFSSWASSDIAVRPRAGGGSQWRRARPRARPTRGPAARGNPPGLRPERSAIWPILRANGALRTTGLVWVVEGEDGAGSSTSQPRTSSMASSAKVLPAQMQAGVAGEAAAKCHLRGDEGARRFDRAQARLPGDGDAVKGGGDADCHQLPVGLSRNEAWCEAHARARHECGARKHRRECRRSPASTRRPDASITRVGTPPAASSARSAPRSRSGSSLHRPPSKARPFSNTHAHRRTLMPPRHPLGSLSRMRHTLSIQIIAVHSSCLYSKGHKMFRRLVSALAITVVTAFRRKPPNPVRFAVTDIRGWRRCSRSSRLPEGAVEAHWARHRADPGQLAHRRRRGDEFRPCRIGAHRPAEYVVMKQLSDPRIVVAWQRPELFRADRRAGQGRSAPSTTSRQESLLRLGRLHPRSISARRKC